MDFDAVQQGTVLIVTIRGRFDAAAAGVFKEKFHEWVNTKSSFVFDLSEMDYIDSTGLGSIVACLKAATEHGGDIKIANLHDKPKMIFEITKAYKIFDIFDNVQNAVNAFINNPS